MGLDRGGASRAEVIPDTIDGLGEMEFGPNGWRVSRGFIVKGLSYGQAVSRPLYALNQRGIPRRGDVHPSPLLYGYVADTFRISPMMNDNTVFKVIVTYAPLEFFVEERPVEEPSDTAPPVLNIGTSVQQVPTNFDAQGNPLRVAYDQIDEGGQSGRVLEHVAEVQKSVPMMTLSYSREEPDNPQEKARTHVGTVNAEPLFDGTDPPRTWLCTGISGQTQNRGQSYTVSYEFARAPLGETWDTTIVFTENGKIPPDIERPIRDPQSGEIITDGNGVRENVPVYAASSFTSLNLTI